MFRPYSSYVSTVLEMCFNRAWGIFRPSLVVCFGRRAKFVSTMLELCLRQCSRYASTVHKYDSTVLEVCFNWLEGCFDHPRGIFWPSPKVCFYRSRELLRLCLMYVSTVLQVFFNRAWDVFQSCLMYLSAVARGMFRPSRKVCFDHARVMFAAMLEICFDRP